MVSETASQPLRLTSTRGRRCGDPPLAKENVAGRLTQTAAEGNGPFNTLDAALRKAMTPAVPRSRRRALRLRARVLEGRDGTSTGVRVLIESGDHRRRWGQRGL